MHTRTTLVRDVMTKRPITISPDASVGSAVETMRERTIRHLPVVDDTGHLLGIITDRDLRAAVVAPALSEFLPTELRRAVKRAAQMLGEIRVKDVMTWGGVTTRPEASVAEAGAVMFEHRIGSLPVRGEGALVGIVTERDIFKALMMTIIPVRGADPDTYFW